MWFKYFLIGTYVLAIVGTAIDDKKPKGVVASTVAIYMLFIAGILHYWP